MGFYDRWILPSIVDLGCGTKPVSKQRAKIVPLAEGRVLEIGFGSGRNLPFYDAAKVERVWGLDPSEGMRRIAARRLVAAGLEVEMLPMPGEEIPLDRASADTILMTYSLCTIPDPLRALAEMARVLKVGGRLLFCEHGVAPDEGVRRWQGRIAPLWGALFGGCRLDRDIPGLLGAGGWGIEKMETMYLPGTPRIAAYNYWGSSLPRQASFS